MEKASDLSCLMSQPWQMQGQIIARKGRKLVVGELKFLLRFLMEEEEGGQLRYREGVNTSSVLFCCFGLWKWDAMDLLSALLLIVTAWGLQGLPELKRKSALHYWLCLGLCSEQKDVACSLAANSGRVSAVSGGVVRSWICCLSAEAMCKSSDCF